MQGIHSVLSKHIKTKNLTLKGRDYFLCGAAILFILCFIDCLSPSRTLISPYIKHIIFLSLIYSILTLSLNFVTGYIGQVSLGHAAFYGFGVYVSAVLTSVFNVSFWIAFPMAGIFASLLAIPLGLTSTRTKGNFLLVITYGFAEVLRYIALNMEITGGPSGLPGIASPVLFVDFMKIGTTGKEAFIIFAFLIASLVAYLTYSIDKSRMGFAFSAIREDEIAALAMGIHVNYYKIVAFVLGAFFAGLAGSIYVHYTSLASPEILAPEQSIMICTMVIFGGVRSVKGSFIGATALVLLPEFLHYMKDVLGLPFDPWMILYGLILIVMMRLRPQGLFGDKTIFNK